MKLKRFRETVSLFHGKKIAVLGDLMLDSYIWGKVSRISPEAPVPVVQVQRETYTLGGAGNVMRNIVTLGGEAEAYGLIGKDTTGDKVLSQLVEYKIGTEGIQVTHDRPTTEKQRVVAGPQQLLRIDYEETGLIEDELRDKIMAALMKKIETREVDAIIFEDYGKGLLSEPMSRLGADVVGIDALILPGGESTAMKIASRSERLYSKLWDLIKEEKIPVLGTCAGAILLSQQGLIQTSIERNAFGRQRESFQSEIRVNLGNDEVFPGVFIRAPRFLQGSKHPIAWLGDEVVGVNEGKIMALTFHPELTNNYKFHLWLLNEAITF